MNLTKGQNEDGDKVHVFIWAAAQWEFQNH